MTTFKRTLWAGLLLLSAGMLFVVLPYQLFQGQFKPSYMLGLAFWIFVGLAAYKRVFGSSEKPGEGA